jgi:hypothetical protein
MKLIISALVASAASAFAPSSTSIAHHRSVAPVVTSIKDKSRSNNNNINDVATRSNYLPLFMGWGPDPIWSTGAVESNIQACPSGSCISLKLNVDDGTEFIYPGQYVQVKPSGGE